MIFKSKNIGNFDLDNGLNDLNPICPLHQLNTQL